MCYLVILIIISVNLNSIAIPTKMIPFQWFSSSEKYVTKPQTARMRKTLFNILRARSFHSPELFLLARMRSTCSSKLNSSFAIS